MQIECTGSVRLKGIQLAASRQVIGAVRVCGRGASTRPGAGWGRDSPSGASPTRSLHLMLGVVASGAMPRTTFDLDPSVLDQLRRRATHEGKSMGQLASEFLAQ